MPHGKQNGKGRRMEQGQMWEQGVSRRIWISVSGWICDISGARGGGFLFYLTLIPHPPTRTEPSDWSMAFTVSVALAFARRSLEQNKYITSDRQNRMYMPQLPMSARILTSIN